MSYLDVMVKLHVYFFQTKRNQKDTYSSHHQPKIKFCFLPFPISCDVVLKFLSRTVNFKRQSRHEYTVPDYLIHRLFKICIFIRYFTFGVMLGGWVEIRETKTVDAEEENDETEKKLIFVQYRGKITCLLYTSPSPRDKRQSRMPSSA